MSVVAIALPKIIQFDRSCGIWQKKTYQNIQFLGLVANNEV